MKKILLLLSLSLALAFFVTGCWDDCDNGDDPNGGSSTEDPDSSYIRGIDIQQATDMLVNGTYHNIQSELPVQA